MEGGDPSPEDGVEVPLLLDPLMESPSRFELQSQQSVDGIRRSPKEIDDRRCGIKAPG